jgi:hypothetical protein
MPNALKMLLLFAVLLLFGVAIAVVITWHDEATAKQRRCQRLDAIGAMENLPMPGTAEGRAYYAELHYQAMQQDLLGPYKVYNNDEIKVFRKKYRKSEKLHE